MRRFYALLAALLMGYCGAVIAPAGRANAQQGEAVRQLEKRVDQLDGQHTGERLARLEALVEGLRSQGETTNKLLLGVCASLIVMLAERALQGGRRRRSLRPVSFEVGEE